jgi:two-component system CheB/CheR fusion protein
VNRFLKIMPGRASLSVLKMAQEGLQLDLRNAINRSKKENVKVRKDNVQIKDGDEAVRTAAFEITPIGIGNLKERYYMIVFHEDSEKSKTRTDKSGSEATTQAQTHGLQGSSKSFPARRNICNR